MDLWIRSQDRLNLVKANRIIIDEIIEDFKDSTSYIIKNAYNGTSDVVGEYKTKERTLEVLDEIQNLLFTRIMCKADTTDDEADLLFCKESQGKMIPDTMLFVKPINLNSIVYQMPEK